MGLIQGVWFFLRQTVKRLWISGRLCSEGKRGKCL